MATEFADEDDADEDDEEKKTCTERWASAVYWIRGPPLRLVMGLTHHAATHPKMYVVGSLVVSCVLLATGLFTNFAVEVERDKLWTPSNSKADQHARWIEHESGFPADARRFSIHINAGGANILSKDGVRHVFEALDTFQSIPEYKDLCTSSSERPPSGPSTSLNMNCEESSIRKFWDYDLDLFLSTVTTDEEAITAMSSPVYPDGTLVNRNGIFGLAEPQFMISPTTIGNHNNANQNASFAQDVRLTSAKAYRSLIGLPSVVEEAEPFERLAIDKLLELRERWNEEEGNIFRLELFSERSFTDEFNRAIWIDLPLMPVVFIIMSIFCCLVFANFHDPVQSQALLGFGAVVTVLLSLMTTYGLLFLIGIPFTSLTQMFPFIMFGVGLDDSFVIAGAYQRTIAHNDDKKDVTHCIMEAMEEVGASVLMTTLTTFVAFTLGTASAVPGVYWLCLYAFPCIMIDFFYQITFFIALMVLDDRRIKANKYDCLVCRTKKQITEATPPTLTPDTTNTREPQQTFVERLMERYCDILMKPWVKAIVLIAFPLLCAGLVYSTTQLKQSFDFRDLVPKGSYVTAFVDHLESHTEEMLFEPNVIFRNVDVSDPAIQASMNSYVDELVSMNSVSSPPIFYWLRDYQNYITEEDEATTNTTTNTTSSLLLEGDHTNMTFEEKVTEFLVDPVYFNLYSKDIVQDPDTGVITASRTAIFMDQVGQFDVLSQIDALAEQRRVTTRQPINAGLRDWKFFNFDPMYFMWEFYSITVEELIKSTVLGITAVVFISILFIPHWSGAIFVAGMMCVLYVDLLGVLQLAGISINSVTYVGLVMSIGLMVDYIMHITVVYFESCAPTRGEKVRDVLMTIGTSVFIGGTTTLLGVVPLAFSTSQVFWNMFVLFLGLVTLGMGHGLILMPVLLSLIGPVGNNNLKPTSRWKSQDREELELPAA
eukprot:scaffold127379_cov52-Attheya_sp.AAC.2